jgi:hypothetical protein
MAIKIDSTNKDIFNFKPMKKLEFKEDTYNRGFIKFGKDNLYPQELIRLYNEHPEHRAIINRKARYIWGKGLKAAKPEQEQKVNDFINSFNRNNTLNELGGKISLNSELFNGLFIEVITNLNGQPLEMYMLNSANCRLSECGEKLYFSKNWKAPMHQLEYKCIEKFKQGNKAGTYFVDFRYYTPSATYLDNIYPTPLYQAIVEDVNTDIDISTFNKNYVANGFSVGKIINFFNGTPTPQMQQEIDRRFKGTYAGEEGESILITHSDRDDKAPEIVNVGVEELAEKFAFTSKRCLKKIFTGHEMSPELFNIKFEDSFLTGAPDLITLQEIFTKGYVEPRQEPLLEFFSYLSYIKTGEYLEFEFEQITMIGKDLSNDVDLTQDERRKLKGYEPLTAPKLDANGQPLPVQATEVNDNLKGLSASENRDMQRIIRDFQAGKNGMNEHLAIARLTAYGLTTDDAKKMLGINTGIDAKMSSQADKIYLALAECAENDNDEDETLLIEAAHIHNSNDALKYERHIMKFADALVISAEELDKAILSNLKANPTLTIDELAKVLNYDAIKISEGIARLVKNGYLEDAAKGFILTPKSNNIEVDPKIEVQVYTVYKYGVNPNKPNLKPGGSSRYFCQKMMELSKSKSWRFETLDKMSNDLGTNVWEYRGGFYNNPKTGEIDPECRHIFLAITKKRTIKK